MDVRNSVSKWWKFDFHNHTPASLDYGREEGADKDIKAKELLLCYMKKEIDCILISDHNTGTYVDEIKKAYVELQNERPSGFRDIYIFPGVEITAKGRIHLLAILDLSMSSDDVNNIMKESKFNGVQGKHNDRTLEPIEKVIDIITKHGGIGVPAHVDDSGGLFRQQKGEILTNTLNICKDNLLALEVVNNDYIFPEEYIKTALNLPTIVGSDSHKTDEIGRYYTWVKMEKPSIEALKLAFKDVENGTIRYDKEDLAST